jgi:hypothetical protein
LRPELREQLRSVTPSVDGTLEYRPCEVTLVDGTTRDRVYVQEASSWFHHWGVDPEDDDGKDHVPVELITSIAETRLPVHLANVVDLFPHEGRSSHHLKAPPSAWSLYEEESGHV